MKLIAVIFSLVATQCVFGDHEAVIGEVVNAKLIETVDPIIMSDTPWHYGG